MIDMAINNGDFIVSDYGDISLHFSDQDNIIQMANSAISTSKGENIFNPEYGNDAWNTRLKSSDSGLAIIEDCVKEAILNASDEIEEVALVEVYRGDGYGECIISYTLITVNGESISSSTNINIL